VTPPLMLCSTDPSMANSITKQDGRYLCLSHLLSLSLPLWISKLFIIPNASQHPLIYTS
jgi:hypothetical protein